MNAILMDHLIDLETLISLTFYFNLKHTVGVTYRGKDFDTKHMPSYYSVTCGWQDFYEFLKNVDEQASMTFVSHTNKGVVSGSSWEWRAEGETGGPTSYDLLERVQTLDEV